MSGALHILKPDGTVEMIRHEKSGSPPYDMLSRAVGGLIERVRIRYRNKVRWAYVNEEGYLKRLPINRHATECLTHPYIGHVIAGNVAVYVPDPRIVK